MCASIRDSPPPPQVLYLYFWGDYRASYHLNLVPILAHIFFRPQMISEGQRRLLQLSHYSSTSLISVLRRCV